MSGSYEIGIRCDYLLTMAGGSGSALRDQFVGINGTKIAAVEPWKNQTSKKFIHAADQVVLPGLINGHTHLPMTLFRGVADDLPFNDWLYNYILPLEGKIVDPGFVTAGTELAALECIRTGVTTVCDMYFFEDRVAEALDRAGLRGVVCEAVTDFPTPDDKAGTGNGFKILEGMIARYGTSGRILPAAGPHAPYTCNDQTLLKAKKFAVENKIPLVIHVSETKSEVEESIKKYGKTPVRRLYDLGIMKPSEGHKAVFAHCVHLTDEDVTLMAETQTGAVYNPESNMKLGAGVAPVPKYLKAGVPVAIGTDGSASNNDLSVFKEMDCGAKLQKLMNGDGAPALSALEALNMATYSGARALGLSDRTGSIEVGKAADVICVDLLRPSMQPVYDVVSQLVYSATGAEVETVLCDGKLLMEKGKPCTLDAGEIFAKVNVYRDKVKAELP